MKVEVNVVFSNEDKQEAMSDVRWHLKEALNAIKGMSEYSDMQACMKDLLSDAKDEYERLDALVYNEQQAEMQEQLVDYFRSVV